MQIGKPLRQMIEQRQGRIVGPVKVLEDHQGRLQRSNSRNEVEKATEQVPPRLSWRQIERWRKIGQDVLELGQQTRQLRPLVAQRSAQTVEVWYAIDEVLKNFHKRQISDGFVMLGAMSDNNRHPLCVSRGRNLTRQPRLADAGFAANQEQAPAPGGRIVESVQQKGAVALAAHHRARGPSPNLLRSTSFR